jgi:hypothetical protein
VRWTRALTTTFFNRSAESASRATLPFEELLRREDDKGASRTAQSLWLVADGDAFLAPKQSLSVV